MAGAFVYVYLFLSVPGSFELQLSGRHDHPVLTLALIGGAGMLLVVLGRIFWRKLRDSGKGRARRRDPRQAT